MFNWKRSSTATLALFAASHASAVTLNFPGGTAEFVGVETSSELTLPGQAPIRGAESGTPPSTSTRNLNINSNGVGEFTSYTHASSSSFARLDYDGLYIGTDLSNTRYSAHASVGYDVTNTDTARYLNYTFSITDTEIDLWGGGVGPGNPFTTFSSDARNGVKLQHIVTVDGVRISDKSFEFWTYRPPLGGDLLSSTLSTGGLIANIDKNIEQFGVDANNVPQFFTTYWYAILPDQDFTVSLGEFDQNETKRLGITMTLSAIHAIERQATVYYEDPGVITGDFSGRITEGVAPAVVPLPAAAWLFGSALIGAGVVGRRENKA